MTSPQFHRIRRRRLLPVIKVSCWIVKPLGIVAARRWWNWITPRICPSEDRNPPGEWHRAKEQPRMDDDGVIRFYGNSNVR